MSSPTNESRNNPGRKRRRRNRGGQNRNPQSQSPQQGARPQGQGRPANQGPRPSRRPQPVKLTWWQKLLKAIGLYKEPAKPVRPQRERTERPERTERVEGPKKERPSQPVKSNVRVARGAEGHQKRDTERERGPVESPRLYVGNLSYDVSESDLTDLFKGIGGVRNIEIVYNRNTHRSKGYGFVEMLHVDDAKRAVEVLHDQFFMGRKLNVSGAKSKGQDEREDRDEEREERRPKPQAAAPAAATVETAESAPAEPVVASETSTPAENQNEAA
jgi:hypothetical protein